MEASEPDPSAVGDFVTALSSFATQIGDGNASPTALVGYCLLFAGVAKALGMDKERMHAVVEYVSHAYEVELLDGTQKHKHGN
jgi:hypothetical protein